MKKRLLFIGSLLIAAHAYAKHKKPAPAHTDDVSATAAQATNQATSWLTENMTLVIGAVTVVLVLLIVRAIMRSAARRKVARSVSYEADHKALVKYWFQCRNCAALLQNHAVPDNHGCTKAHHHHWTQMAEVGWTAYTCRKCQVTIRAKNPPTDHGCTKAVLHGWVKK